MDKKKKILIADDAKLFIEVEKTFLQRESIEIITALDGRQALELARQHRPDIAILDMNMPGLDGAECCRTIKLDPGLSATAIVIVTTQGRAHDRERCRDAGCDELLFKPINRTEFLAAVHKLLQLSTRQARYKARFQVQYGENDGTVLTEFGVDISSGGLYISTENPLDVGESLVLRLSLESHTQEVVCKGQVAWVNSPPKLKKPDLPPGMGIRFVDISLEDLHIIRNFMESNQLVPSW